MKRKYIGRVAGAAAASLALGGVMAQSAMAAAPDPAPFCSAYTNLAPTSPGGPASIPDGTLVDPLVPTGPSNPGAAVTKTISVTNATGKIRDLDVITNITHPINRELEITLSKQGGKSVRLVSSRVNGRAGANGYDGTRWDDSAPKTVSEANEDLNTSAAGLATLSPEGSLATFIGDDPNGTWTLSVRDYAHEDTGQLNGFSLNIATSETVPATAVSSVQGTGGSIPETPGAGIVEKTITVSGAKSYLTDLNLLTDIEHNLDPGELTIRLMSPQGTTVLISNHRGSGSQRSLTTTWNDSATALITSAAWTPGLTRNEVVPEGSLGAFIGQNPNGDWKLIVEDTEPKDLVNTDGFVLNKWNLNITSTDGCPPPPPGDPAPPLTPEPPAPPVVPTIAPVATVALPAPRCVKVPLGTKLLGATAIKKGKTGVVTVQVKNNGSASATSTSASFAVPSGFTVVSKPKGASLKKGRITMSLGTIAARKAKSFSVTLKAGAKASTGLRKSTVSTSAACGSTGSGKLAVTIKKA